MSQLPRALGLAAGVALDALFGDPRRGHPVAAFGRAAAALEQRDYADSRARGLAHVAVCAGVAAAPAALLQRRLRGRPLLEFTAVAATAWAVTGARSLRHISERAVVALTADDLPAAREVLPSLCGRDPSGLGSKEIARAVIESVAENTSDAMVAPLLWGAAAGLPGLVAYRAINTLDAMIGHHSSRYERFGWAAARLDDAANWIPSRVTALLAVACARTRARTAVLDAWRAWRRYGAQHPSPNAGQCESAFAGALGVRLGGTNVYHGVPETRPELGDGRPPEPADVRHAIRLSRNISIAATALAALAATAKARLKLLAAACGVRRAACSGRRTARGRGSGGRRAAGNRQRGGAVRGALMVAGTSSDAGKSVLVAGLCRWLARQGVKVAPFKAQNMSLNSFVTLDGAEIGRAQAMQAAAAGIEPTADMNPVLLKPGSDRRSHLIVRGQPDGEADAVGYRAHAPRLRQIALESLNRLREQYEVVISEGAGSPAEINLRATDIANMGLARAANLPVVVVGDIDRGGVFAAMYGTLALLDPDDQKLIAGFVINKFRGAPELLTSGLDMLTERTKRPVLGVLPYRQGLRFDAEDSLALDQTENHGSFGPNDLEVAVVRLPRISNFTDADALAAEPGVRVRFVTRPDDVAAADLAILPGSRATVSDLAWLRENKLADAIAWRAANNKPTLGICAGYQMMATEIDDQVESRAGKIKGLGLLPITVRFDENKTLTRKARTGYEIRHGTTTINGETQEFPGGCRRGTVSGTTWHGALEDDEFRRTFLTEIAAQAGRAFTPAPDTEFAKVREQRLDVLGDLVEAHLDTKTLTTLIEQGPPPLPSVLASPQSGG